MEGKNGLWVIVEKSTEGFRNVALELITRGRSLADSLGEATGTRPEVWGVVTGTGVLSGAEVLYRYGCDGVMAVSHPMLEDHRTDLHALVIADLIKKSNPLIVLLGATAWGSEVAPSVAAKVRTGLAAHCADLRINSGGLLVQSVPAFGGKVLGEILCPSHRPQMASVRPGVFPAVPLDNPRPGALIEVVPDLPPDHGRIKVLEIREQEGAEKPLEEAEVVVAGGWGVGSRENWKLLEELADLLGGSVGCTRPALDEGWAGGDHTMIGTSGKTVRPRVYIGFGISGATHHVVGMKDSGLVVSVNTNPSAEMFQYSDVKVVADARAVCEALIAGLKAGKTPRD